MNNYKIYAHINKQNGKAYIGITKQELSARWRNGGKGYSAQPKFYQAILKYGWDNFEHYILADEIEEEVEALELETYYIDSYNSIDNGYNILRQGINSMPRFKPVFCITTNTKYNSIKEAAKATDCLPTRIIQNCKGQIGPTKGYEWTYWDESKQEPAPIVPFVPKERNKTRIFCIETNTFYNSIHEAAELLGIDRRGLQRALNQERNGINGMHFVRENEMEKIPEIIKKQTGHGKKIFCQETKQIFDNLEQAAQFCGKTAQSVMKNCQGKTKTCANYHFKYLIDLSIEDIMLLYQGEMENE